MAKELSRLLEEGRLRVGDRLYHSKRQLEGRSVITARITRDGVEVDGRVYSSLSTAGRAAAGHAVNGWIFWRLRRSGERLDTLHKNVG
jgi:hypothetical protein